LAVVAVLLTRLYLNLTGFPHIGAGGLHIAHLLWGGLVNAADMLREVILGGRNPCRSRPHASAAQLQRLRRTTGR
jgi:hypothetical protein